LSSVVDPHPDADSTYHPDADPDSDFLFDADPDLVPDPAYHFDAIANPDF